MNEGRQPSLTEFIIILKAAAIGVLAAETVFLLAAFSPQIVVLLGKFYTHKTLTVLLLGAVLILVVGVLYRGFITSLVRIFLQSGWQLWLAAIIGVLVSYMFGGFGETLYAKLAVVLTGNIAHGQFVYLVFAGLSLLLLWIISSIPLFAGKEHKKRKSFFINDEEIRLRENDLLGYSDIAEKFAKNVINGGSRDSLVFGVDGPWGVGKSSFLNFCAEYWDAEHRDEVIIYRFNPLRYEDRGDLLEVFVDGLIKSIRKHSFSLGIKPLFSQYMKFMTAKTKMSFLGFELELVPGSYSIDDAFHDLEKALIRLGRKVIIIIDDLDRLPFSSIKHVLFTVKKSFTLPNLSYVLCYDTDNIVELGKSDSDAIKVNEFLEKFINVKIGLFVDSSKLSNFVEESMQVALIDTQADTFLVSQALAGLKHIYSAKNYHQYAAFVGDLRKLKRLLNTILLLEIEQTNFKHSDVAHEDLIHLLLLYINHPEVFRKVYNAETGGKRGFFSVVTEYEDGYPKDNTGHNKRQFENSTFFNEYLKTVNPSAKFLLTQLFDVSVRLESQKHHGQFSENFTEGALHTFACFNGGMGGTGPNLENYLELVVKQSKPSAETQYRFYLDAKNNFQSGSSLADILSAQEFSAQNNEESHRLLWRTIVNSARELGGERVNEAIGYLLTNICKHSLISNKDIGVGLRDDLIYFLIKLLDNAGRIDENGHHRNNTNENVIGIADWIFGEGNVVGKGVLATLSEKEREAIGFFDLMVFRLYCCADRGGDIFNLQQALSLHSNPEAPKDGLLRDIVIEEMREVSQQVFQIFAERYIGPQKNFFEEVAQLSFEKLAGDWSFYIEKKVGEEKILSQDELEDLHEETRNRVASFVIYQLANNKISSGIGCGYYDVHGSDDKDGIAYKVNSYLFSTCFDPDAKQENFGYFIDYLLRNLVTPFDTGLERAVPSLAKFLDVLDKDMFKDYWLKYADCLKEYVQENGDKKVITDNYSVEYSQVADELFEELSKLDDQRGDDEE